MKNALRRRYERVQRFMQKNQRYVAPAALIIGFVLDNLTLNRIDQTFDQAILIAHLSIIAVVILVQFRWFRFGKLWGLQAKHIGWLYTLLAFSIGGIYSGLVIFYGRAGSLLTSWPLLAILALFLFGSEFAKKYFRALTVQLTTFLTALYLYLLILVPLINDAMGVGQFVQATLWWLLASVVYLMILARVGKMWSLRILFARGWILVVIFGIVVGSYVTRILPPVPLSLKFDAAYHLVERTPAGYLGEYEPNPWLRFWDRRSNNLAYTEGQPIYVFTSVFAPDGFTTKVYHQWQRRVDGEWVTTDRIGMTVVGGSDGGFRGYSFKRNLPTDEWRVRTVTEDDRVIGITYVNLRRGEEKPETVVEEL